MPRLPGVSPSEAPEEVTRVCELATAHFGKLLDPLTVTAHNLEIFRAYVAFESAYATARSLDKGLKDLASLKVAALIGCPFCLDLGSAEARRAGLTDEKLRALSDFRSSDAFSPLEKLVLDYATAMTATNVVVPDELFEALRARMTPAQLVELTSTIAWENYRSRFNHALGIGAQGFSDGAYCVLPERPAGSEHQTAHRAAG